MDALRHYNGPETGMVGTACRNPTLTEQLTNRKALLEEQLKEIDEVLTALKDNPKVEGLLNLIAKVRY